MKSRKTIIWLSSLLAMLAVVFVVGCQKHFDEPPTGIDPGVTANTTIKDLKASVSLPSGAFAQLSGGKIIKGTVVANDKSGNIYKAIYIQDETGGLEVDLDATGLYNQYPVGREIFIVTDSLYLANETGMIKLGMRTFSNGTYSLSGIPSVMIDKYIKRGSLNNPVVPKQVTLAQLDNSYQSMLVQLTGYEVQASDRNKTWADTSVNKASQNINIRDCGSNSTIIRSSGYANFAGIKVPQGNGTVTAIYTVFNTTKQLLIRDTSDVQFKGVRCGSVDPSTLTKKTIQEIRALYTGSPATIPAKTAIEGIIVSNTANEAAGNYRIQDGSNYGIQIRFTTAGNPQALLGDKFLVDVSGLTVDLFNGDMQINNVASSLQTGTGTVAPRVTTVSAINTNLASSASNNWSSTVVTLNNVSITQTSSNTTGVNYAITDATGSIVSFVRNTLGVTLPAFATSITGYVSLYLGTPQLTIRNAADVVAGVNPAAAVTTTAITGITQTAAVSGGNVTSAGSSSVTARGVVWSTAPNPTVALSTKTSDGTGTGTFTSNITGLTANTTYYVRAYATNSSGTSYGNEISFTTQTASGGSTISETFETGAKSSYAAAAVTLNSGSWTFSDAVIGTTAGSDIMNGLQAARIRGQVGSNNGYIQTEFGVQGLKTVEVAHAQTNFNEGTGTVTPSFELYISKDNGTTWTKVGNAVTSTKGTLNTATFTVNAAAGENVRVRILNTSSASISAPTNQVRINIDDVKFNY